MKIAVNKCFGGFGLSHAALARYSELAGHSFDEYSSDDASRADPILIAVIEELGDAANGEYAILDIVEIPDGIEWTIEEYDGREWVAEKHRTW